MHWLSRLPLIALPCFQTNIAFAQNRDISVAGVGATTCRQIVAGVELTKDQMLRHAILSWIQGYISGLNSTLVALGKPYIQLGSFTPEAQLEIVLSRCKEIPERTLAEATLKLIELLGPANPK